MRPLFFLCLDLFVALLPFASVTVQFTHWTVVRITRALQKSRLPSSVSTGQPPTIWSVYISPDPPPSWAHGVVHILFCDFRNPNKLQGQIQTNSVDPVQIHLDPFVLVRCVREPEGRRIDSRMAESSSSPPVATKSEPSGSLSPSTSVELHRRSKTGCMFILQAGTQYRCWHVLGKTCRRRKKKCDEARPGCKTLLSHLPMCKALSQSSLSRHHLLRGVEAEVIHHAFSACQSFPRRWGIRYAFTGHDSDSKSIVHFDRLHQGKDWTLEEDSDTRLQSMTSTLKIREPSSKIQSARNPMLTQLQAKIAQRTTSSAVDMRWGNLGGKALAVKALVCLWP